MNRWELVQALFEETAELAPAERARVLGERAAGDPELARSVETLIAADARPLAALDGTATDLLRELRGEEPAEEPPEALCGRTFGPYRIDGHVSSGGMAHVYGATCLRAGVERRVALKVLRPGLHTDAFLARFRRERETLAALEHEHVVSFLDADALPDGRPFLVMEYVEGVPLTVWGRGVPLRRRLELLLQVLAAVQHAHQRLVVHRDLKPSNVLVTRPGVPKLLDFGVATVLEAGASAGEHGPLTPGYASPEELHGGPVTTASDVYSLGVLLHELATGEMPGALPGALPGATGASAPLRGDLGAIARKALAPDPRERYRSADRMADDLRRFLASEPVGARRTGWAHRARLFARRHRFAVALVAAILAAAVAGWTGSDLARRRAEADAHRGWGAHGQAKAAARVFETWIEAAAAADPELGRRAAAHLEASLGGGLVEQPEAEALVRIAAARLWLELGELERAAVHVDRAWELAQGAASLGQADRGRVAELRERVARARSGGE